MKQKIPYNYRRVKTNELLRNGDVYYCKNTMYFADRSLYGTLEIGDNAIGLIARTFRRHCFFRKRKQDHVSPTPALKQAVTIHAAMVAKPTVKKVTVSFPYPNKDTCGFRYRVIELLTMDDTYIAGVERNAEGKYQFKKFLRSRIPAQGNVVLVRYGN